MTTTIEKLETIFDLASVLGHQNDFEELLRLVTSTTSTLFWAEVTSVMMINPSTQNTVKTVMNEGLHPTQKSNQLIQTNVIGWVAKTNKSFLSPDIRYDDRFTDGLFKNDNVQSVMCAPLVGDGITIGYLLALTNCDDNKYSIDELHLFEKLAAVVSPFLSNTQRIQDYFNSPLPENSLLTKYQTVGLMGKSQEFINLLRAIESATHCDVRVLLEGQSGTGKELIANAIHMFSARNEKPFVAVDCGAIPETLIESELFGHVKGAFTGAIKDRKGLIQQAESGTLFMDEIGNLPIEMQAKLLRVLQEGEVRPVGSNDPIKVNVRIIAACSTPLRTLVENQSFRQDLYYRLYVYPIQIPALNDRRDDILLLANHFLQKFSTNQQKKANSLNGPLLKFLRMRNWIGNIRELENLVERLVTIIDAESTSITQDILPIDLVDEYHSFSDSNDSIYGESLKQQLQNSEYRILREALAENNWNQSKAAAALQTTEQLVRYRMKKLGITRPR